MHTLPPQAAVVVTYQPGKVGLRRATVWLRGHEECHIALENEEDQAGRALTVELSLRCAHIGRGADLLEINAPKPGYQPFMFSASDLAGGPDKTDYGKSRTIFVRQTHCSLQINIEGSDVVRNISDAQFPYRISYLPPKGAPLQ
jgi:hypothetical protein